MRLHLWPSFVASVKVLNTAVQAGGKVILAGAGKSGNVC